MSGNRAFGIKQNTDGSFTIYTRGVDRVTLRIEELIAGGILSYIGNNGFNPFSKADELWNAFQDNLVDFIQNNGGSATRIQVEPKRVDWEVVHDELMGN